MPSTMSKLPTEIIERITNKSDIQTRINLYDASLINNELNFLVLKYLLLDNYLLF